MSRVRPITLAASLAVWLVAGCGGGTPGSQQAPTGAATFDVTISHGQVTPTNAIWQVKTGRPVSVRVTSDATDELHVHSSPDHEFEVAAAPNQMFTFTIDVPGSVEVELHHLDKTIATLQVQP